MADLDAEILALAGDSSDEESPAAPTTNAQPDPPKSPSYSPPPQTKNTPPPQPGVARKVIARSKARPKKTQKSKSESDDEGEATSESEHNNAMDSALMSESDSERSTTAHGDYDGPLYPLEGQYQNEKDKAEILALPEIQREQILAERAAEIERKKQDVTLRRLLQTYQSNDSDQKKRKAGAAELEETQRKSSRQKTTLGGRKVGEPSDAIEAYKKRREEKGIANEQRKRDVEDRKERKRRDSLNHSSDVDADGESEFEWDDGKPKTNIHVSPPRDELPADLADYNRVRIGRDNFAMVCFYPGFDEKIKNCFTRVNIGPDKLTGENVYRVTQIKAFNEGRPYAMEGSNGKSFVTNQYALVTYGKSEKEWPFIACSNAKFTDSELERYNHTLNDQSLAIPTKPFLISKIADINSLINHRFTDAEIQEKLRRSGVLAQKNSFIERAGLIARRREAEARGNESAIMKIDADLAALEGPKLAFGTSLHKVSPQKKEKTQQERLAELNRINRKQNVQDVRRAQIAERKADRLVQEAIARGEATANPFARVKTRAKILHDSAELHSIKKLSKEDDLFGEVGSNEASRQGTPLPGAKEDGSKVANRTVTPKPSEKTGEAKKKTKNKWGGLGMPCGYDEDEVAASLDFGIDIEISM